MIEQKAFRGKLWVAFGMEQFVRRVWEHFTLKERGPDQFWQMWKKKADGMEGD